LAASPAGPAGPAGAHRRGRALRHRRPGPVRHHDAGHRRRQPAAAAAPDGRAALHALIDGFLASSPRARQHWVLWLDFWALSAHDGGYASRQAVFYQRWQQDVAAIFRRGLADGTLLAEDPEEAVAEFMAIFDGMASKAYLPGADIRPAEARSRLHRYVDRIPR
jgi:BetI-type transcriptional repressor, C-terminal